MYFLSKEHEYQFLNLLQKDKTHPSDVERLALFYIIAGNADLLSGLDVENFI